MYGELKRAIHLDFHTMPGIYNFNEKWDPAVFAERLAKSHVRYINAFAECNLGFAYFDTKIGVKYPGMKGDMFGDLLRECHKRDIGVTAYFNLGIDHEACRRHRDWCKVNRDGQILYGDRTSHSFRLPCYETGYGDYQFGMIKELLELHPEVDGIFLDCINFNPCYGNECLEAIKAEGGDPLNDEDVRKHTYNSVMNFLARVRALIGDRNMICNSQPYWMMRRFNSHIEVECLPGSGWGYDYFNVQAAYARGIKDKVLYMSGRFQGSWGDFGGLKTQESLENDMYDALMNAVECSVGDHMNPAENLDESVYEEIRRVYEKIMAKEPWTDGAKYKADIGILTHIDSGFLRGSYAGIVRMLSELHYSFDIVNETMDFTKYKMLIIPDSLRLSPMLKEKVAAHVRAGKPVLSSGLGGLEENADKFALPEWNFEVEGIDTSSCPYYKCRGGDPFRYAGYNAGILMKAYEGAEVFADYYKAYFNRVFDGFHGNAYLPPEKPTGHVMAARIGNVAHIAFKAFEAYNQKAYVAHKLLVKRVIESLGFVPSYTTEVLPSTSRVTLTETDKHMLVHVKVDCPERRGMVDVIEEHTRFPAGGIVRVDGCYDGGVILPDDLGDSAVPADVTYDERGAVIRLPEITGYLCVALQKK